jgi:hypothetical protein
MAHQPMIRGRRWIHKKAIDRQVEYDISHQFPGDHAMTTIPMECHDFLRNNKQVICPDQRIRFVALNAIREEVIAGKADDLDVIDFDFDTGEATLVCVYCVTGVEHPDGSSPEEPLLTTLH